MTSFDFDNNKKKQAQNVTLVLAKTPRMHFLFTIEIHSKLLPSVPNLSYHMNASPIKKWGDFKNNKKKHD
jgi:hypothetical protein